MAVDIIPKDINNNNKVMVHHHLNKVHTLVTDLKLEVVIPHLNKEVTHHPNKAMVDKDLMGVSITVLRVLYIYHPIAPPGSDPQLWNWFTAVDTDHSGQLSVDELQRALVNGDWSPFNIETVRTMVNMFDKDNSGTIDFNEFAGLWKYIEDWKRCFQTFDADNSGNIDVVEMRNALKTFGYNLSDQFIRVLVQKFDKYGHAAGKGNITFDNFVQACVTVKTLTDSFRQFDTDNDGWIQINYEQFLELVIRQRT
ncbi:uncharacterized protein B0P05DRAFT_527151 [Gilbertella persicaria]|uniref:uncharacterized protein n=1 Tax=Gilbertella persicaria TaxID=101096 RepID=UPI0022209FCB|nr:uncharacterized protein B0P05DRAFT_527151 [Gilbertella persicaria]KAI8091361.1 hypothetical protein B0P05DRAFT_527151 [Gilbertella persicaria]